MKKRILSSLPILCMLLILLPISARAMETRSTPQEKWIDRVNLSREADDLYQWLVTETKPGGILTKVLPEGFKVTDSNGTFYRKKVFEYTATYNGNNDETWKNKFQNEYSPEIKTVLDAFDRDHPEVFWLNRESGGISIQAAMTAVSGTATVTVYLDFTNIYKTPYANTQEGIARLTGDIAARDSQIAAIKQVADAKTSRKEKIEAVSSWLTTNNDYYYENGKTPDDAPGTAHDCLGALKGQKLANGPVCEGYAKAFKAVCDRLEIPCVLVDGYANSNGRPQSTDGHMWNYVQMEDGKWSAVDVTWNDPPLANSSGVNGNGNQQYTLVGANTVINGKAFSATHEVKNEPSDSASELFRTNAPVLSDEAYAKVEGLTITTSPAPGSGQTIVEVTRDGAGASLQVSATATVNGTTNQTVTSKTSWFYCVGTYGADAVLMDLTVAADGTVNSLSSLPVGTITIVGKYGAATATAAVKIVKSADIISIKLTGEPLIKDYAHGDTFNPYGLTVIADYTDGSTEDITDRAVFNGGKPLTVGQTTVEVTFDGKIATIKNINVEKKSILFVPIWSASTFTYDGTEKTVTASGLPVEVKVTYTNNRGTNAGSYNVFASFALAEGYNADYYDLKVTTANVTLTISKATPAGTPTCTPITADGKTLADAPLSIGTITPSDGTLAWTLGSDTQVARDTAYQWTFTPTDSTNYNNLTGQLTPYHYVASTPAPDSGRPSSGSSSTSESTGSGTQTTAKPSVTVSGSSASAEISPSAGSEIVSQAVRNGSETVVIAPNIQSGVTSTRVTIPATTVGELGRRTGADIVVDTPVAQVAIPNGALNSLSKGSLTVSASRQGSTLSVTVQSGDQAVHSVSGGLTVTAPISTDVPSGTVAVLVNSDGSREVIRKSAAMDGTINIPLEGSAQVEIVDNSKSFKDVPSNNWAFGAVSFASSHELFNGTGDNSFSPNISMTRGMVAMVLYNLENNPDSGRDNHFSDVADGVWYAGAVTWAAQQGIVYGYPDGSFGANKGVTREQLAVMLYRYSGSPRVAASSIDRFSDASSISSYARESMNWAVENGIINGIGGNQLAPRGQATRAQVAQMLKNYIENQF